MKSLENVIVNDNIDGSCLGKGGLHLNPKGSGLGAGLGVGLGAGFGVSFSFLFVKMCLVKDSLNILYQVMLKLYLLR